MVSLRRPPNGSRQLVGRVVRMGAVALAALLIVLLGVVPANAQLPAPPPAPPPAPAPAPAPNPAPAPAPPATPADAAAKLAEVQREAEALTEQWHGAKDTLAARKGDVTTLNAAVAPARVAVDAAKAEEETYRKQVDVVAMSTFESGKLDQFNALLASKSPQDFLDQMSALEAIASEHRIALEKLIAVVDNTSRAEAAAAGAVARAQAAVDEAARAEQDLGTRKREAEVRIDEAERLLGRLSPQQRRDRAGPGESAPTITGTGVGVSALKAAITKIGMPYQWGATGPRAFDCSGLTSWAFKQVGITIPRGSSAQAGVGTPISWDEMRPGDLVFYYRPVSHVGIYAGDGKMVDAPQTGDNVKFNRVSPTAFSGARRL